MCPMAPPGPPIFEIGTRAGPDQGIDGSLCVEGGRIRSVVVPLSFSSEMPVEMPGVNHGSRSVRPLGGHSEGSTL